MSFDLVEHREEVGGVPIRLLVAPAVAGVAIDFVEPQRCGLLDTNDHVVSPGSGQ